MHVQCGPKELPPPLEGMRLCIEFLSWVAANRRNGLVNIPPCFGRALFLGVVPMPFALPCANKGIQNLSRVCSEASYRSTVSLHSIANVISFDCAFQEWDEKNTHLHPSQIRQRIRSIHVSFLAGLDPQEDPASWFQGL